MVAWIAMEKLGPTKKRNNRISGPTLIVMIGTQLVSLSTSLFLLESHYGRLNSNREAWSHYVYVRKNRSSGPIFTVMIETKVVSLSRSLFLLDGKGSHFLRLGSCSSIGGCDKYWRRIEQKKITFFCSVFDSHPSPSLLQKWSHFLRHCSYSSPSMVVWIAMEKPGPTTYTRIEAVVPLWSSGFQHELVSLSTSRFMLKHRRMWQVLKKDWAKKITFFCSVFDSHPSPSLLQKWSHFLRHCSYSSPSMVVWIAMEKLGPTTYTRIEAVVPFSTWWLKQKWSHFLCHCSYSSPSILVWIAIEKLGPTTFVRIETVVPFSPWWLKHELFTLSTLQFILES